MSSGDRLAIPSFRGCLGIAGVLSLGFAGIGLFLSVMEGENIFDDSPAGILLFLVPGPCCCSCEPIGG